MNDDRLTLPPGYKTGCLPRKLAFGKVPGCPPMADVIETIPERDWGDLIGNVALCPNVRQILDQGRNGSCATESTTQGVLIVRDVAGLPFVLLNPLSIYRVTSGGRDQGSNIDSNLIFARDIGILPESYWPRSKGFRAIPPDGWEDVAKPYRIEEFYDIRNKVEVGSALLKGFAVVFGWSGHSCIMTRLLSKTAARYANSWGMYSGSDNGFDTIKLRSINFGYGAFAIRTATSEGGILVPEPRV